MNEAVKEIKELIDLACSLPNMPQVTRDALAHSTVKKIAKIVKENS